MRVPRTFLAPLAIALLCVSTATVARADAITFVGTRTTTNNPMGIVNLGKCGAAPNLLFTANTGSGTSNLGAFTTAESNCINPPAGGAITNGLFTITLANGNTFFGTYSGTVTLPPVMGMAPVSLTYLVTGGTGLFAGATGSLAVTGQVFFNPDGTTNNVLNFNGTINTVPDPATLLLLGTGLAGVDAKVRRRRKTRT